MTNELKPVSVEVKRNPITKSYTVDPVWAGVDRPVVGGIVVRTEKQVRRLTAAFLSGKATPNARIVTDISGKTYVTHDLAIMGRHLDADLKRLGF